MPCSLRMGFIRAPATGSFICRNTETCGVEVSNCRKSVRHHLKKFHKLPASVIASVWLAASRFSAEFPVTHPLREHYKTSGGRHGCLLKIHGLPILGYKECPTCFRMFPTEDGLRRHFGQKHRTMTRWMPGHLRQFRASLLRPIAPRRSFSSWCARRGRADC